MDALSPNLSYPLDLADIVCLQNALLNWRQGLDRQFCLVSLRILKNLVLQLIGNWSHYSGSNETTKFREQLQGLGSFQAIGNFHRQRDTTLVQVQIKLSWSLKTVPPVNCSSSFSGSKHIVVCYFLKVLSVLLFPYNWAFDPDFSLNT